MIEITTVGLELDDRPYLQGAQRVAGASEQLDQQFKRLEAEANRLSQQLAKALNTDPAGVYRLGAAVASASSQVEKSTILYRANGVEAVNAAGKLEQLGRAEERLASMSLDVQLKKDQAALADFRAETERATAAAQKRADTASNQIAKTDATLALKEQTRASDAAAVSGAALSGVLATVGVAAVGAAKELFDMAREGAQLALQMKVTADEIGITVEQMSFIKAVGEQNGVGIDRFRTAFEMFEKNIASEGSRAFNLIKASGVDMQKAADDPSHAFMQYLEVLAQLPQRATAVAAAKDTMGRSGASLLRVEDDLLARGGNLEDEFKRLGIAMGEDTVTGAARAAKASIELTQ